MAGGYEAEGLRDVKDGPKRLGQENLPQAGHAPVALTV